MPTEIFNSITVSSVRALINDKRVLSCRIAIDPKLSPLGSLATLDIPKSWLRSILRGQHDSDGFRFNATLSERGVLFVEGV